MAGSKTKPHLPDFAKNVLWTPELRNMHVWAIGLVGTGATLGVTPPQRLSVTALQAVTRLGSDDPRELRAGQPFFSGRRKKVAPGA